MLSNEHRNFSFENKSIKIPFFCNMTPRHCVIFSRHCHNNYLSRHFRNRVSSEVASYLEGKETSHPAARVYKTSNFTLFSNTQTSPSLQAVTSLNSTRQLLGKKVGRVTVHPG